MVDRGPLQCLFCKKKTGNLHLMKITPAENYREGVGVLFVWPLTNNDCRSVLLHINVTSKGSPLGYVFKRLKTGTF